MSRGKKLQIFRGADSVDLMQSGIMTMEPPTAIQQAATEKLMAAGMMEGSEVKVLVNLPGFSLTYVWFKKDYPLPLHSHDVDCLYYVVAGSLELGAESLGPRDSFFLPAGAAYTYRPGPDGVEVLEFRNATAFDIKNLAKSAAFYDKAAETIAANRDAWKRAKRPMANI